MVVRARELRAAVKRNGREPVIVLRRSAPSLEDDFRLRSMRAPR